MLLDALSIARVGHDALYMLVRESLRVEYQDAHALTLAKTVEWVRLLPLPDTSRELMRLSNVGSTIDLDILSLRTKVGYMERQPPVAQMA